MANTTSAKPVRFTPAQKKDDPPEVQAKNIWQYVDNISRFAGIIEMNCKSALNGAEYFEAGHIREIQMHLRRIQNIVGAMRSSRPSGTGGSS